MAKGIKFSNWWISGKAILHQKYRKKLQKHLPTWENTYGAWEKQTTEVKLKWICCKSYNMKKDQTGKLNYLNSFTKMTGLWVNFLSINNSWYEILGIMESILIEKLNILSCIISEESAVFQMTHLWPCHITEWLLRKYDLNKFRPLTPQKWLNHLTHS